MTREQILENMSKALLAAAKMLEEVKAMDDSAYNQIRPVIHM